MLFHIFILLCEKKVVPLHCKTKRKEKIMETYVIAINFFSEPNFQGNCSRYYFVRKNGNKVTYSGIVNAKRYVNETAAKKMASKLGEIFPTAMIMVI